MTNQNNDWRSFFWTEPEKETVKTPEPIINISQGNEDKTTPPPAIIKIPHTILKKD